MATVSVRMLHYYDEIGLFKSSSKSEAGYRLYDDNDLKELKEILFFKELEVPLKEIKRIMDSPYFDKIKTLKEQKKLLSLKRDRLNGIIESLDKTIRGENNMSFKEFDMTEYYKVLEEYRDSNKENIIKTFGSIEKFDDFIEYIKNNEEKIALNTVKAYGSTEKYAKEVRKVLNNKKFNNMSNGFKKFWDDCFSRKNESLDLYFRELSKNKKNKVADATLFSAGSSFVLPCKRF
ncbi:DNA-binding transcriptional regulator, MerR family [Clostridium sp. DSM 8431]|uniref:MerR family transcriptional regulator n=1 Tax=Clostridium sp. DSM 8431 TaxID=1761781 RepID=UPI0008E00D88|nr:MerR family transcriptional regulator [Clostridium sp. DSM 8431]SFU52753.1 DNA-binding transcriptional regulator, MerR family [Clostridium sp. DSM 8431]